MRSITIFSLDNLFRARGMKPGLPKNEVEMIDYSLARHVE